MRVSSYLLKAAALPAALLFLTQAVGCEMPTYTLYDPGEPSETLTAFFEAVNSCQEDDINDLLYNGSWKNETETPLSAGDTALENALAESRSFEIIDKKYDPTDSCRVSITVSLTTMDIKLFEQKLTDDVEAEIKDRIYQGEDISKPSAIAEIIEVHKLDLLKEPEWFYSSALCTVDLICSRGKWCVVLTDELYDTLLGLR